MYQQIAKDYLRRVRDADVELQVNRYRQEELLVIAEQCGAIVVGDRVQSTPKDTTMAEAVELLIEEQRRVSQMIDYWLEVKSDAVEKISELDDPRYKEVLYRRYIMRMRRWQIAEKMNYSEEHIKTLQRNALDELGRRLADV